MAGTARHEGSKPFALQSGNQSGSRWGLRGIEDLGGGLKGIFTLESGFNVDDGKMGQSGRLFGRAAYVGLQNQWGRLTLVVTPPLASTSVWPSTR
jgi:predicted porin